MNLLQLGALMLLAAIWGASFLFIRMAVPSFGPFVLMEIRVLLGGAALWAAAALFRRRAHWLPRWREYLLLGAVNAAVPFTLIAAAELVLPASLAAISNALTPGFTALVAARWLGQRISPRLALGLGVAFAGVAVSVGWSPVAVGLQPLLAAVAVALASFFYAVGSNYSARAFPGANPLTMSVGQNMGAAIVLLPFAVVFAPKTGPTPVAAGAALGLALLCTAMAYQLYFWLLNHVGPTRTTSVTYLVPLFGMLWGRLVLDEPLTPGMFGGLALVFAGIMLMADVSFGPKRAKRAPEKAGL